MGWLRHTLTRLRMGMTRQRLLGSAAVSLVTLVLVDRRAIAAGQFDLPGMMTGLLAGIIVGYRAWPAIDVERWRRWKRPDR